MFQYNNCERNNINKINCYYIYIYILYTYLMLNSIGFFYYINKLTKIKGLIQIFIKKLTMCLIGKS